MLQVYKAKETTTDAIKLLPYILETVLGILDDDGLNFLPSVNPCINNWQDPKCLISCSELELGRGEYALASCQVHHRVVLGRKIAPWFKYSSSFETSPQPLGNQVFNIGVELAYDEGRNTPERYLKKVSKVITNEDILYDVGLNLGVSVDAIEISLQDNPRSIVMAAYKVLLCWRNRLAKSGQPHNIDSLKMKLEEAFTESKIGSKLDKIH